MTGACVDGEGNMIADWNWKIKPKNKNAVTKESMMQKMGLSTMFQSNSSYYNNVISDGKSQETWSKQSPVNISTISVVENKMFGPITFKYSSVWRNSLAETPNTPQPTVVTNTGITWEVKVPSHHQQMIYGGPLLSKNYRLDQYHAHWGRSEHTVDEEEMDGELQLVHHHIQYK